MLGKNFWQQQLVLPESYFLRCSQSVHLPKNLLEWLDMASTMNPSIVHHIAQLANIPVTADEEKKLADGFTTTLAVVDELKKVNVKDVAPTHQVSGLVNVLREDTVDMDRMFTQE